MQKQCCMPHPFLSCLPSCCWPKGIISSLCISYFFHCCDKIVDKSNLRKEGFILALNIKGYYTLSWQCKYEVAGNIVSTHSQEAENNGYRYSASFGLCIQSKTSAHGMGPFSVREGHSSTINLNSLINMPRELFL